MPSSDTSNLDSNGRSVRYCAKSRRVARLKEAISCVGISKSSDRYTFLQRYGILTHWSFLSDLRTSSWNHAYKMYNVLSSGLWLPPTDLSVSLLEFLKFIETESTSHGSIRYCRLPRIWNERWSGGRCVWLLPVHAYLSAGLCIGLVIDWFHSLKKAV